MSSFGSGKQKDCRRIRYELPITSVSSDTVMKTREGSEGRRETDAPFEHSCGETVRATPVYGSRCGQTKAMMLRSATVGP